MFFTTTYYCCGFILRLLIDGNKFVFFSRVEKMLSNEHTLTHTSAFYVLHRATESHCRPNRIKTAVFCISPKLLYIVSERDCLLRYLMVDGHVLILLLMMFSLKSNNTFNIHMYR